VLAPSTANQAGGQAAAGVHRRFEHQFQAAGAGAGLVHTTRFLGWRISDKVQWAAAQALLATLGAAPPAA